MAWRFVELVLTVFVVVVLVRASVSKLASPGPVVRSVNELFPNIDVQRWAIFALVALELATAFSAAFRGFTVLVELVGLAALGSLFIIAGTLGAIRGSEEPCGCFGAASASSLGWRNTAFGVALLIYGLFQACAPIDYAARVAVVACLASISLVCLAAQSERYVALSVFQTISQRFERIRT